MKKQISILVFLIIVFFGIYLFSQNRDNNVGVGSNPIIVCIKTSCFDVETADNVQKREIGLMNRKNMPANNGMFFIFEKEGIYSFWMKNTLIPLDIIWIDEKYKIIYIENNAQPCQTLQCETYGPNQKAKYVLEINEGLAEEMGIEVGDEVDFK